VRSITLPDFEHAEENVACNVDDLTQIELPERPRQWLALILPVFALLLWMLVGSLLTWLMADFDRSLAPAKSTVPPWLIFSLFLAPALIVGCLLFFRSSASGTRE